MDASATLTLEHETLLEFLYLCPVGIVDCDGGGGVLRMNPKAAQLLVPNAGANLGNLFTALDPALPGIGTLVSEHPGNGIVCAGRRLGFGAAPAFTHVLSLTVVRLEESRIMAVLEDVTDSVRLEILRDESDRKMEAALVSLRESRELAESASRAKSDFLATMSHEIRSPLSGILGMAEVLLNSDLTVRQRKRAQLVRDAAAALLQVLNDILDISKVEANKLELETIDFDLRGVVEGVADLMAVKSQEKGLELTCLVEPGVTTHLSGDPGRLRQVLFNLVSNAVKFTPSGEVSIRVRQGLANERGLVRFEVTDTGIGVPSAKQSLLFERFSQAEVSTARQYGGSGLGLSIVRHLVEMMGGKTGFRSAEGKGSTFWFTAALPTKLNYERPPALSLAGKRVLVVDDNQASHVLVRTLLAFWKCDAEDAGNAEAALDRLRDRTRKPFDAVLIDLQPGGGPSYTGGEQLGAAIRLDARLAGTPIVLLIPLSQIHIHGEWESQGFVGQVTKPIKQGELGACFAAAFNLPPMTHLSVLKAERPDPDQTGAGGPYRLLVVEDNPVNQEVAVAILKHLGYLADAVPDGRSALRALRETAYTLVLTDCQMPGMDGYELSKLIRDPSTGVLNPLIPIIALTANSLPADREECLAAGMNDYLSKPLRAEALSEVLNRWIRAGAGAGGPAAAPDQTKLPEAGFEAREPPVATPEDKSTFDEDDLVERMMGNEELAKRVAAAFVDGMPDQLIALANAIGRSDGPATMQAAHSIRGAAANAGGVAVRDLALKLEQSGVTGAVASGSEVLPDLTASFQALRPAVRRFCDRGLIG